MNDLGLLIIIFGWDRHSVAVSIPNLFVQLFKSWPPEATFIRNVFFTTTIIKNRTNELITSMTDTYLLNVRIDNLAFSGAIDRIERLISEKRQAFVVTPNVDHVVRLQKDPEFRNIYRKADLVLTDGMPIVWASRLLKTPIKERITGADMFGRLCQFAARKGYKIFLLGGRPGAALGAGKAMKSLFPGLQVAGVSCPPYGFDHDEHEKRKIIDHINRCKPDIVFVGLGSPKQEKWIYENRKLCGAPLYMGVGVTFEFASGMVRRAPRFIQAIGFEWLWRLANEPGRLWKRYLIDDMKFIRLVFDQLIKK